MSCDMMDCIVSIISHMSLVPKHQRAVIGKCAKYETKCHLHNSTLVTRFVCDYDIYAEKLMENPKVISILMEFIISSCFLGAKFRHQGVYEFNRYSAEKSQLL